MRSLLRRAYNLISDKEKQEEGSGKLARVQGGNTQIKQGPIIRAHPHCHGLLDQEGESALQKQLQAKLRVMLPNQRLTQQVTVIGRKGLMM